MNAKHLKLAPFGAGCNFSDRTGYKQERAGEFMTIYVKLFFYSCCLNLAVFAL
jgi:hypothetical protein